MTIHEFIWPEDRVAHIAQHGVRPEEVEDVCFGRALVQRTQGTLEAGRVTALPEVWDSLGKARRQTATICAGGVG